MSNRRTTHRRSHGRTHGGAHRHPKGVQWRRWLLALLLLCGVIFAGLHWGDVKKFAELTAKAEPLWLLAALALQTCTYVALSAEWMLVLRAGGTRLAIWRLFPLTIIKLFADQVIPTAGMSGNVVLVQRLISTGAPRKNAVAAVLLAIVGYYASYAVCALAALVLLWLRTDVSRFVLAIISLFLCVAAAIPALVLWLQRKGRRALPNWLRRNEAIEDLFKMIGQAPARLVRSRRLIVQVSLLNGAVFVIDALTLQFCLFALGQRVAFETAFVPFILASIVVTLGPIPLGLGSFEATSIAMQRALGVPFEAALSATLLFRGFALWLPLIAGMMLARRELKLA